MTLNKSYIIRRVWNFIILYKNYNTNLTTPLKKNVYFTCEHELM